MPTDTESSDHSAEYLAHGAEFILLGEGEITLGELLDSLSGRSQQPLEAIQSLAFYSKKGEPGSLLQTPRRPEIKDLDSLPFPAWDLVDVPRYQTDLARAPRVLLDEYGHNPRLSISLQLVPRNRFGASATTCASPENVVAELGCLLARPVGRIWIWFMDDIFGLKPGWLPKYTDPCSNPKAGKSPSSPSAGWICCYALARSKP